MTVGVLTAVADLELEAGLAAALGEGAGEVRVVRRCLDLADLLAVAAAGGAQAAVISADLRRLDRDALTRLAVGGVAVVGAVPAGADEQRARLETLGVAHVVEGVDRERVVAAVLAAVEAGPIAALSGGALRFGALGNGSGLGLGDPAAALPSTAVREPAVEPTGGAGRLVAVWGPAGAPGRSTVATALASELADLGRSAVLVDADTYGGVVAQLLGLLDEAPGLAAACRAANSGALDVRTLREHCRQVNPKLRVLTGITRAERWPEIRPAALDAVLDTARGLAAVTVIDCGFALEQDEELVYDVVAPRRNGATVGALEAADEVVVVGSADPVGLQRLVRGLAELRELVPGAQPRVVVNRVRRGAVGPGDPVREIAAALERYAGVRQASYVPLDVPGVDTALAAGRTLAEAAPTSPARLALRALAAELGDVAATPARRRRLLLR